MTKQPDSPAAGLGRAPFVVYLLLCGLLLTADLVFDRYQDHPLESWSGFYCVFGFASLMVIVLLAKLLRRVVQCTGGDDAGY